MHLGFLACYNDKVHMPAMERNVMATLNQTELPYLDLLNTIASGERRTGVFLQAWADTTPDPV